MKELDARGLQCPKPLMMAKKELDAGCADLAVMVSNEAAVSNLSHLAKRFGRSVSIEQRQDYWAVTIGGSSEGATTSGAEPCECLVREPYAVFVGKDHVGEGDEKLGKSLMKMALYTLSESGNPPAHLLFMNGGVKLVGGAGNRGPGVRNLPRLLRLEGAAGGWRGVEHVRYPGPYAGIL